MSLGRDTIQPVTVAMTLETQVRHGFAMFDQLRDQLMPVLGGQGKAHLGCSHRMARHALQAGEGLPGGMGTSNLGARAIGESCTVPTSGPSDDFRVH